MALEDKFKDELRDIGDLNRILSKLNAATTPDERNPLYLQAATIVGGRDDPRNGKKIFDEQFPNLSQDGAYSWIQGAIPERIDQKISDREEDNELKDEYKRKVDEITAVIAKKLDERIAKLDKEDREKKYKVIDILSPYFNDLLNIPEKQAQELLASQLKLSSSAALRNMSAEGIKEIMVRLTSAEYVEKSNGTYRLNRTKLKELVEKSLTAGAVLYAQAAQN